MLRINSYSIRSIVEGMLSFLPWGLNLMKKGTQGTNSSRYCYSVWLRHLVKSNVGRKSPLYNVIVELGPGDSLGIGLAALLSGACRYIAIDSVQHANVEQNLKILNELVSLFNSKANIPTNEEFPNIKPLLDDYCFPERILSSKLMQQNLAPSRVQSIRDALQNRSASHSMVMYVSPQTASTLIELNSVDMVFSQAVLEHVDDLASIYQESHVWLKSGGIMSHQIDFKSHGTSREWNGHWVYPDWVWRLIRGRRPYLLNREPCSTHLALLKKTGFELVATERTRLPSRLELYQLSNRFRYLTGDDLTTAGAYILAGKRADS